MPHKKRSRPAGNRTAQNSLGGDTRSLSRKLRRKQDQATYGCADCNSDVKTRPTVDPLIRHVEIRHDDTCPWLRAAGGEHRQYFIIPRSRLS
jgi:hypothetical protein